MGRLYGTGLTEDQIADLKRISEVSNNAEEGLTLALRVINTDHAYIHDGIGFKSKLFVDTLAKTASESYSLVTGTKHVHLKNLVLVAVGASILVELIRGTTADPLVLNSAGSTATELTGPHNVNDNSEHVTQVAIKKTPTYVDNQDGAVWDAVLAPGASTNQFQSVSDVSMGENFEYVLKP